MNNKNLICEIGNKIDKNLKLIKQLPVKSYMGRAVHYICKDLENKKYIIAVAYTTTQKYRLKKFIKNIEYIDLNWKKYICVNNPISFGEVCDAFYVVFNYFEDAKRMKIDDESLFNIFSRIAEEQCYTQEINEEFVNNLIDKLIEQRCPDILSTRNLLKNSEEILAFKETLLKYKEISFVHTHCDTKYQNVLIHDDKKYLIGCEYGGIDLPVGYDLFVIKKYQNSHDFTNIPYLEIHEAIHKIQFPKTNANWLKYLEPIIKIDSQNTCIKIREQQNTVTIPIIKTFLISNYNLTIDFNGYNISPCAMHKLVILIKKKFDLQYTVNFKNCPYWFDGLFQENDNTLSFYGIINKKIINPKSLKEWITTNQAYINYSRILPYVKPYWFRALMAVLICIPIGSLDAVIALSLKPYMDLVMVEKTIESPWYIPFGIVAFTSIQGGLNYLATYLNTWVGGKITNDLKMTLYKKMLTFETGYFDKKKSGDIVFRFNNDADIACSGLLENLKTFTSRLFSSISLVGVLFYNSWQLALVATVVLGGAFLPLTNIRKRIKSVMDQSVNAGSAIITAYNESFAGNKTIISYNLASRQENKFKDILSNIFTLKIKMVQRTSWLSPMMHVIVSIGIGLAIGYGSHLILTGKITSGNFVSFITALIMLYTPIKNLGNNFNSVQMSFMAIERVFSVLESKPKIIDKPNAINLKGIDKSIEFNNVCFEYIKDRPVLTNLNLHINKGETLALVGNSGGGKSTTVSLIPRFYDIKSGEIKIDDVNIKDYTLKSLRNNIAVVFQDNFLFSGTIKENILLGNANATDDDIYKAIKMAYLDEFIATLKDGLNTQIGERGILLSGGQKQRVAIARAFLKDAPIIILDEATSALDNKAEAIVQKAIENLMKDKTVFVIAHRLSTVQNANKIAVINGGILVELGSHEELMNIVNGQYKALYEMQFKKQEVV